MSTLRWLFAVAGTVVGIAAITLVHNVQARVQPPGQTMSPRMVASTCAVPPAFGAFKGVWGDWLVFEDAAGTLRAVNNACEVRHAIARQ